MSVPATIIPVRRRVRRGRERTVANRILRVTHDTVGNRRISVIVEGPLTNVMELGGAMEVSADGVTWIATNVAYYDSPPLLTLQFPSDISGANRWRITDVNLWHFQNGRSLTPPLSGSIE